MTTSGDHSVIVDNTRASSDLVGVIVKKERMDEDIKEYAETAMNELLGWYGYANSPKDLLPRKDTVIRRGAPQSQNGDGEAEKSPANSSGSESLTSGHTRTTELCGWCGKPMDEHSGLTSNNTIFCSELCFSQSRRANFKKNKTCDWCKHVRHTVSYVDFQDGASQLQFCSDKCLNQYKMHIFCRETRAHLEMHPHLAAEDTSSALITPDLWMKNCKSPSSRTSSPVRLEERPTSPLPLITIAHPSKLMASPGAHMGADKLLLGGGHSRRKRLRKRGAQPFNKNDVAQDLRVARNVPSISNPYLAKSSSSTSSMAVNGHREFPEITSRLFANANNAEMQFRRLNGNGPVSEAMRRDHGHLSCTTNPIPTSIQPGMAGIPGYSMFRPNLVPPIAVMVPYPVLLPVPIPIPIPLPFSAFLQAAKLSKPSQNGAGNASHHNGAENGDLECDTDETNLENGTGPGCRSQDDEEIVVDDVSKEARTCHNAEKGDGDKRKPVKVLSHRGKRMEASGCPLGPSIQHHKRKREIGSGGSKANGNKISNSDSYKLKKSVSV